MGHVEEAQALGIRLGELVLEILNDRFVTKEQYQTLEEKYNRLEKSLILLSQDVPLYTNSHRRKIT
jgi:hypothetical protein